MIFKFEHSYANQLPDFYVRCKPEKVAEPRLLYLNQSLADRLLLDLNSADTTTLAAIFSGNSLPHNADPIAQAYAGHQFGNFSKQLGDGRALLLGEVFDDQGQRRDIALKGSGRTPFSRNGDGKAAVGPMLREALIGEFMHAMGIATTRALAVVASGERVYRQTTLPGAVLTRVAASHVRFGTFEFFAARGAKGHVKQLADYCIARHYPELMDSAERYVAFLRAVINRQALLIAQWMGVGFIHGVMNTDNMSIAGDTIDYGPCAFMEAYDAKAVFSSIDEQGRYSYENQPSIAQWNLARLAEALLPLLSDNEQHAFAIASDLIESFSAIYSAHWLSVMRAKLGLNAAFNNKVDDAINHADTALVNEWLLLLQANQVDFTESWIKLSDAAKGDISALCAMFSNQAAFNAWLVKWQARCAQDDQIILAHELLHTDLAQSECKLGLARAQRMRAVNPYFIPRNHRVEEALTAASEQDNMEPFNLLMAALSQPAVADEGLMRFAESASSKFTLNYRTFCGT